MKRRPRSRPRPSRTCSRAWTCWATPLPAPARPPLLPCRCWPDSTFPAAQQVQVMVLAPTRELAIQVAEAFQRYAARINGLSRPAHLRRPGLCRADPPAEARRARWWSVPRAGSWTTCARARSSSAPCRPWCWMRPMRCCAWAFIDDVEWVLEQTPEAAPDGAVLGDHAQGDRAHRAASPARAAGDFHQDPAPPPPPPSASATGRSSACHKLDALTRILEVEPFDAILMFVRTKTATTEAG